MKKFMLVLSVISILFLAGCNKDEDLNNEDTNLTQDIENKQEVSSINDIEDLKEVAKSYISVINSIEKIAPNEHRYKLAYINDDEIPELVVDKPSYYTGIIVSLENELYIAGDESVAIVDNIVEDLNALSYLGYGTSRSGGFDYVEKESIISSVIPGLTSSGINIQKLNGNILEQDSYLSTQLFDASLPVSEDDIDENVNIDLLETKYYLDGNEISEAEYMEKSSVLSNSKSLNYDVITASEIIEDIRLLVELEDENDNSNLLENYDELIYTPDEYKISLYDGDIVSEFPYINIKSEDVSIINAKIEKIFQDYNASETEDVKYSYEYTEDNGILSILIKGEKLYLESTYPVLCAFNIEIATGKMLSSEEFLTRNNISKVEFENKINKSIVEYYSHFEEEEHIEDIKNTYILKDDNYEVYKDADNKIYAIVEIMKLAGSGAPGLSIYEYN